MWLLIFVATCSETSAATSFPKVIVFLRESEIRFPIFPAFEQFLAIDFHGPFFGIVLDTQRLRSYPRVLYSGTQFRLIFKFLLENLLLIIAKTPRPLICFPF